MAIGFLFLLLLATVGWLAFTIGRVSADRRVHLNHHQMAMTLIDLSSKDDIVPVYPAGTRDKVNRLIDEYERLDLDE